MKTLIAFTVSVLGSLAALAAPVLPQRGLVQEYDTVVAALASNPSVLTDTYVIKGLFAINDGLAGKFYFLPGDTSVTNETDCFEWRTGRLKRTYDGVTASRVIVTGTSTNYANQITIGNYLRMANVVGGENAVFDANGLLTNGIAGSGTNVPVIQLGPFTTGYIPIANGTNTLTDSVLHITNSGSAGPHTNIIFGPQNKTYIESGIGQNPAFILGDGVRWFESSGSSTHSGASQWNFTIPGSPGTSMTLSSGIFQLLRNSSMELDIYGHQSGSGLTNFSYLSTKHEGTNGYIILDSRGGGAAGNPRPIRLNFGGTNYFEYTYDNGAFALPRFAVKDSPGTSYIRLQLTGGVVPTIDGSTSIAFADDVVTKNILTDSDNTYDIGSMANNGTFKDNFFKGSHYAVGANDGTGNYNRLSIRHLGNGSDGAIVFDSQAAGTGTIKPFAFTNASVYISKNVGAVLTTGDAAFVDLQTASQTNSISGTMTFAHATNGIDAMEWTHVRTFFNGSGSDRTVNLPSGWHKGVGAGSSFVVTNNTLAKMYVTSTGPTASSATQTNVTVTVSFFP